MDPSRHAENRGFVESVLRYIPGFHGYLEKEYRRESDQLTRNHIADQLNNAKRALDGYLLRLVETAQLDALPKGERLKARIDTLASRVRGGVQGYSGFFDYVKVDEALLDRVYQHDMKLLEGVKSFVTSAEGLAERTDDPSKVLDGLLEELDRLSKNYDQRGELLAGVGSEK